MDLMGEIADATIERLKTDKDFENWTDERFSKLKNLLTSKILDTEEAIEEYANELMSIVMEEKEK